MNLSTLALILLAWQLLSNSPNTQRNASQSPKIGLTDFLSDDTKNMLNCMGKISSGQCSQEDKTSAIFQMMANPAVMNLASNIFGGSQNSEAPASQSDNSSAGNQDHTSEHVNSEGYHFEKPSASSQEFFRQIDNIADTEIKHKLYWFYDHWYL